MANDPIGAKVADQDPHSVSASSSVEQPKEPAKSLMEGIVVALALSAWRAGVQAASAHWKAVVVATTGFILGGATTIYSPIASPKALMGSSKPATSATETWYGLSRELKNVECGADPASAKEIDAVLSDDKRYGFFYDVWEFQLADGSFSGQQRPLDAQRTAAVSGFFLKGDFFAASMKSAKGRGVYFLQAEPNQEYYFGKQIAFDCSERVILSCPYILGPQSVLLKLQQDSTFIKTTRCRRE